MVEELWNKVTRILLMGGTVFLLNGCLTGDQGFPEVDTSLINSENPASVFLEEPHFDFGDVIEGDRVTHTYQFKNNGKSPLSITDIKGECGCTVPENWPTNPIPPGEEGSFDVVFNSQDNKGKTKKLVTILANTYPDTRTVVSFEANVVAP